LANFDVVGQEKEKDEETTILSQKIVRDSSEVRQTQRRVFLVTEGHRSKKTEDKYRVGFQHFLDNIRISDLDALLDPTLGEKPNDIL
jgi:hypothetical protein